MKIGIQMKRVFFLLLSLLAACTNNESQALYGISTEDTYMDSLMTEVQLSTFQYFWDGAEQYSGLARERIHLDELALDAHLITSGGTGFGVMAILVGIERNFISRAEGLQRLERITSFLENADRYHGVWAHWIDGRTGRTVPFSPKDDAADLVETAYLIQGLLCVRQYFKDGNEKERALSDRIDKLWKSVEWRHFRGADKENVLFWHWSPDYAWEMNFRIKGYNECLITYVLAAASPSYGIDADVYHQGWADGGKIKSDEDAALPLYHQGDEPLGGPLFWAQYSFLGLDPRNLRDRYADYWKHNVGHTRLNYEYCVANPLNYKGYGENCWGLTASYSINFYAAHSPKHDVGVITPTAALSSMPYTPEESKRVLKYFFENKQEKIYGPYGFYDAFSEHYEWYPRRYLAIDQGPIIVMIENYRSQLLWKLFMSCPEIDSALTKLGYESW